MCAPRDAYSRRTVGWFSKSRRLRTDYEVRLDRSEVRLLPTDELHARKDFRVRTQSRCAQDRLQLFFSTHDVTLSGCSARGKVVAVKTGHARYLNLCPEAPFVVTIIVEPVGKDSANVRA